MLSVTDLVIERGEDPICGPLTFSLQSGEIIHIKGPNGAGKTTLMKTLLGLLPHHQGQIDYGDDLSHSNIGYIGHKLGLTPELTVKENLTYLSFGEWPIGDIDKAIDKVGLRLELDSFVSNLSEGQKKRAALARFYYMKKKLWFLDEPLSALDVKYQTLFLDILERYLSQGGMVILSSHQSFALNNITVQALSLA